MSWRVTGLSVVVSHHFHFLALLMCSVLLRSAPPAPQVPTPPPRSPPLPTLFCLPCPALPCPLRCLPLPLPLLPAMEAG
ncbi:hypothetical protein M758_9G190100 [Ceratodon purpureus]|nr:hypothetical protein M758_9G190100 [Ceratodon purpureus]